MAEAKGKGTRSMDGVAAGTLPPHSWWRTAAQMWVIRYKAWLAGCILQGERGQRKASVPYWDEVM